MLKCRILFKKTGVAKYISHLDIMRTMQRLFVRAGVPIVHTQGFNPHPYMVFALPLSVGTESVCELMDIELEDERIPLKDIPKTLNAYAPEGIEYVSAYIPERKFKDFCFLSVEGIFEYDREIEDVAEKLEAFFSAPEIVINKKTKKGYADTDIKPGIRKISFTDIDNGNVAVKAILTAQNPTTNPELIPSALRALAPNLAPDFSEFRRVETLDGEMKKFK